MNSKVMMMAALAVCGCARMEEGAVPSDSEMVELSFHVPCQRTTKVSGSVVEDAVYLSCFFPPFSSPHPFFFFIFCRKGDSPPHACKKFPFTEVSVLEQIEQSEEEISIEILL